MTEATGLVKLAQLPVHPAAKVFPMLGKEELTDLAADIKANGLLNPIVIGEHGGETVVIDGRNRRAACELAGVDATTTTLNGQDPVSFIVSSNINRRHMTKGQRAMAVAVLYPDSQKLRRKGSSPLKNEELKSAYLSQARTVLKYAPEHSETVLAGGMALNDAYTEAKTRKVAANNADAKFAELQEIAPDLADLVTEERMALSEALSAADERERNEQVNRQAQIEQIYQFNNIAGLVREAKHIQRTADLIKDYPDEYEKFAQHELSVLMESLRIVAKRTQKLIEHLEN